MSGVNRYISTHILPGAGDWNSSVAPHTYVHAADYDRLAQECERLRATCDEQHGQMIEAFEERDAALKQVEGLRELLSQVAPHFSAPPGLGHLHAKIDAELQDKP